MIIKFDYKIIEYCKKGINMKNLFHKLIYNILLNGYNLL